MKQIIFSYGRFNPPTIGHKVLVDKCRSLAATTTSDYRIFTSSTYDSKKNPLTIGEKLHFLGKFFPNTTFAHERTLFSACRALAAEGYTRGILVVGSDRGQDMITSLKPYINHPDPNLDVGLKEILLFQVNRNGVSATKVRQAAVEGNYKLFSSMLPESEDSLKKEVYDAVRSTMGAKNG